MAEEVQMKDHIACNVDPKLYSSCLVIEGSLWPLHRFGFLATHKGVPARLVLSFV
jgi:hypothetical protein